MKLRYKIPAVVLLLVLAALSALAIAVSYDSACGPAPAPAGDSAVMKAMTHRCYGSPGVIEVTEVDKPVPADDEVLVRVRAASVNPLDWHFVRGSPYIMRLDSGIGKPEVTRLGVDFAGIVEAVGKDVTRFRPGDEVFGGRTGAYGEYITVGEDRNIVPKPPDVTFAEAAAIPIAGVTALQAVRDKGNLKAGQSVLVNGASGGVGTFAVQIAKAFGAEVTGVCSTRNLEMVRSLGADHVIDYTKKNFTEGAQRYDVIIDNVGNYPLLDYRKVLVPGGIVVMVGGPGGNWVGPLVNPLKALFISPFVAEKFTFFIAELNQEDLRILASMVQKGQLTAVIDRHYSLGEVPAAIAYSEEGHARGKIVIDVP